MIQADDMHAPASALSESVEMYLKTVFELGTGGDYVPISAVAGRLDISPVSATEMVHKLEAEGLFEHVPYRGVRLAPLGRSRAEQILRRHRIWECFLHDRLGVGWVDVHDLACSLEHAVDEDVTEPLADWLGQPASCPHGNPIPEAPNQDMAGGVELGQLSAGDPAIVVRIRPERADVLAYLDARALRPGAEIRLQSREALDGTLTLVLDGRTVVVGQSVAAHVIVRRRPPAKGAIP
jgi:DtxR family Mn-dependent transcriptional regulator